MQVPAVETALVFYKGPPVPDQGSRSPERPIFGRCCRKGTPKLRLRRRYGSPVQAPHLNSGKKTRGGRFAHRGLSRAITESSGYGHRSGRGKPELVEHAIKRIASHDRLSDSSSRRLRSSRGHLRLAKDEGGPRARSRSWLFFETLRGLLRTRLMNDIDMIPTMCNGHDTHRTPESLPGLF